MELNPEQERIVRSAIEKIEFRIEEWGEFEKSSEELKNEIKLISRSGPLIDEDRDLVIKYEEMFNTGKLENLKHKKYLERLKNMLSQQKKI